MTVLLGDVKREAKTILEEMGASHMVIATVQTALTARAFSSELSPNEEAILFLYERAARGGSMEFVA